MDQMRKEWLEQMQKQGFAHPHEIKSMATELLELREKFNQQKPRPEGQAVLQGGILDKKKLYYAAEYINDGLRWTSTPEGETYWSNVYDILRAKSGM